MKTAFPRFAARIPVSSQARFRLAEIPAGRAERAGKAEGKIKQTGTMSGRFGKLSLSAHWLAGPRPAPWFSPRSAGVSRKALALLGFDRHYGSKWGVFPRFSWGARP
ncbi:hypothetical protein NDN16_17825 [Aureimonas altamirensis]|uniref:hypothetical protein n=1 Tax=Aureimonas altamirensis TaxID=370622 RepID=UPI002036C5C2|nr:hypothetical protein [Aureimonas altamirensis]MCM2505527.1 hypothetical protein [Aureimonas altamirensis]